MSKKVSQWLERLNNLDLPIEIYQRLFAEIRDYSEIGRADSDSMEHYFEFVLRLPWGDQTIESVDLDKARILLDQKIYGHETLKRLLLDQIAVENHLGKGKGKVMLLHGPSGTGKTHIAQCYAEATGKLFYPMRLGGLQDSVSILGTYRGYKNARSSYLMDYIARQGSKNIVVLLDEIDKLDPKNFIVQHALLQLTDRTTGFIDGYLDLPFDLSQVTFIATANDISQITPAMIDRMDVIEVSAYSQDVLHQIMMGYLIPKKMEEFDLSRLKIDILPDAYTAMREWCMMGSIRHINHKIDELFASAIRNFLENGSVAISKHDVLQRKQPSFRAFSLESFDCVH